MLGRPLPFDEPGVFFLMAVKQPGTSAVGREEGRVMSLKWWHGWGLLILLPITVIWAVPSAWPRWLFMWILALVIFVGCKWLTWRRTLAPEASCRLHVGYLFAWPGMDAVAFLAPRRNPITSSPAPREWLFATVKLAIGVGVLFGVTRLVPHEIPYLVGWTGMIGLIMVLHFGSFHLLSCGWRGVGVEARPLMCWPLASVSIGEFWGRRWNTAFRDLTYRFLFRPLKSRFGPRPALFAGFAVSGLIHDLVISIPAGGGYGGPTLFFVLQGLGLFAERSKAGRRIGLGRGSRGRLFTATVLLLSAYFLFHPPFVGEIVLPFLQTLGAT
jgi:hypothetical protein